MKEAALRKKTALTKDNLNALLFHTGFYDFVIKNNVIVLTKLFFRILFLLPHNSGRMNHLSMHLLDLPS